MNTVMLIEDEDSLRRGICFKLEKEGYEVFACGGISEAKARLRQREPQLILCDISLPDGSGLDFCRYLRETLHSDVRFIFLTAMDMEIDIVMGYEAGADDYITKPFSLAVLLSKVKAVFQRMERSPKSKNGGAPVLSSGRLCYYPDEMQLWMDGQAVSLTKNEYKLLQLFLNHPKQILSKTQILEQMFDTDGSFADENTVAVNIRRLRAKIGDDETKRMIKNIRGMGYLWDCEVESEY